MSYSLGKEHYLPKDIVNAKRTKAPALSGLKVILVPVRSVSPMYPSERRGAGTQVMVQLRGEKVWRRVMSSSHGVLWVVIGGKKRYLGSSMVPENRAEAARWNRSRRHSDSRSRHLRYIRENEPAGIGVYSGLSYEEARRKARAIRHTKTRSRR